MSEWRDIATAPKSNQVVLFWVPGRELPYMSRGDDWHFNAYWLEKATHWMPLPEPPK